jgi:hypothetical protein
METIKIKVEGIPPHKDRSRSIRNRKHPNHDRFLVLRKEAKNSMKGRDYYTGPVAVKFHYVRNDGNRTVGDYLSGILDTLDGSHGFTFHWEPIVFLDDCQIVQIECSQEDGEKDIYVAEVSFLTEAH